MAAKNVLKTQGKRELDRLCIYRTSDGDFIVEHCFKEPVRGKDEPWTPNPPEPHVFTDEKTMLDHVAAAWASKEK